MESSNFSNGVRSRKVHPLWSKPVVNSDDVQSYRLTVARNANRHRPSFLYKLGRISRLHGDKLCDIFEHRCLHNLHSPSFAQIASTLAFVAPSISIIAGHGRSNPSAFHFRVASIPIFDP